MPAVRLELFSVKQRVFLVKHFYQSFGDCRLVKSDYEAFYGASQICQVSDAAISELIELFEDTGSVLKSIRVVPQEALEPLKKSEVKPIKSPPKIVHLDLKQGLSLEKEHKNVKTGFREDPLQDLDCFEKQEEEDEACQEERENQSQRIKEESFEVADEEETDASGYKEVDFHSDGEGVSTTVQSDSTPEVTSRKLRKESFHFQKIKVIRVNKQLEETIVYTDDDEAPTGVESPERDSDKVTCPRCDKVCKTLKGHKCFLLACTYCRMKFPRKDLQKHMKRNHHNKKLHSCEFCEKLFLRRDDLQSHRRTHTKEKPFMCRVEGCEERFQWRTALKRHELSVHVKDSTEMFTCSFCPASFRLKEYVLNHMKQWHDYKERSPGERRELQERRMKRRWKVCPNCRERFDMSTMHRCNEEEPEVLPEALSEPTQEDIRDRHNTCEVCQMFFEREEDLQNHRVAIHSKPRPFVCGFQGCGKSFCWRQSLRRHEHTHKEDWNKFKCDYCFYFSHSQEFLTRHLVKVHRIPESYEDVQSTSRADFTVPKLEIESEDEVQEIPLEKFCGNCNEEIRGEHSCDLLICVHCQEKFPKDDLVMHIMTQHAKPKHFCQVCGKMFRRLQNFRNHQKIHVQQQKLFVCGTCGKACVRKYDLKSHEKVHTKERPYICQIDSCRRSFAWLHSLRRHERLHAKKKARFSCKLCSKSFSAKTHMMGHHMRNHQCGLCRELFRSRDELLRHQEAHRTGSSSVRGAGRRNPQEFAQVTLK